MKTRKIFTIVFTLLAIIIASLIISCNKDYENEISEDILIEVKQEVPYIIYLDEDDLNSQISEAISITHLSIPEDAIVFSNTINSDMSQVTIWIDIKEEFKSLYRFPEGFENIFIIDIKNIRDSVRDFLFGASLNWQASPDQTNELETFLCQNIDGYDFQNATTICIPVVFYVLENANFQQSSTNAIIETLNSAFLNSKIQFSFDRVATFSISDNEYNLININNIGDLPKDLNKLNIYISDYLGIGNGIDEARLALAHYPVFNVFTNAVFIGSRFINQIEYPNQSMLCHEIGHTFSLYHTFETAGYSHNFCPTYEGDGIIGTVPQNGSIPQEDTTCDDWNNSNYMSYSFLYGFKQCDFNFIDEQNKRMRLAADYWLSEIFCENTQNVIPTVTTSVVMNITGISATIGGNIINDGGADITIKGICWGISPNPTIADSTTNDGMGLGSFMSSITDLMPNTQYYARAYATNSVGTGYGEDMSFTTEISSGGTFLGNVDLTTQQEVNDFGSNNYSAIDGWLFIDGAMINDISPLSSINSISGLLTIQGTQLTNLNGLNNLTQTGGLNIRNTALLQNLNDLNSITSIDGLCEIDNNSILINLDGLSNLIHIQERLYIHHNVSLSGIDGLSSLNTINGFLNISDNDDLVSLNGLENLTSVGENLDIKFNDGINNFCAIQNLLQNNGVMGVVNIDNNFFNPTAQDIIDGNCSQ